MVKKRHPPLHQESDLGTTKKYRGISLTAAKVYNALSLNRIKPEIEKNSLEKSKWFSEKSTTLQILAIRRIVKGVCEKISRQHFRS